MTSLSNTSGSPHLGTHALLRGTLIAAAAISTCFIAGPATPAPKVTATVEPAVLVTPDDRGSGSLLLRTLVPGKYIEAPRLKTDVEVEVSGLIARATITQRFENPSDKWVEGIYVYPLPQSSAVDTLKMQVGSRYLEGKIKERAEAREIYEKAAAEGIKASLVEQERPNMFTNSVANIGPKETVVVQIEYQQAVQFENGKFELRVPLVVGPRYIPGQNDPVVSVSTERASSSTVGDAARITPPVLHPKFGKINPVTLRVKLNSGTSLNTIQSAFHNADIRRTADNAATLELAGSVPADRDFVMNWTLKAQAQPQASLFREVVDGKNYYFGMIVPPSGSVTSPRQSREAIFVIDNSGSMAGKSMGQAKSALMKALSKLKPEDTFNVIRFDDTFDVLFKEAVPANSTNVKVATRFVSKLDANGGTEILAALQAALKEDGSVKSTRLRQVIFLTDGAVGNEDEVLKEVGRSLGRSRLFTIGIGSAPNSFLMEHIATLGRGSFTHIGSENEVEEKVGELFGKLESPVMTDLKVRVVGASLETWPNPLPDLYAGEPVMLSTSSDAKAGKVIIEGKLSGAPWSAELELADATEGRGVSKIWARSKISAIESSRYKGAKEGDVDAQVLTVALSHHLVSRMTSLVAVDVAVSRPSAEGLETQEMPTNLPHGWNFEKVFGEDVSDTSIETNLDQKALMQLAMVDKPKAVNGGEGVALPQTDAGTNLLIFFGLLLVLSGLMVSLVPALRRARS